MENADIIRRLEDFAIRHGISPGTVCLRAVNDHKVVTRLREGKSITLTTLNRLIAFMDEMDRRRWQRDPGDETKEAVA